MSKFSTNTDDAKLTTNIPISEYPQVPVHVPTISEIVRNLKIRVFRIEKPLWVSFRPFRTMVT